MLCLIPNMFCFILLATVRIGDEVGNSRSVVVVVCNFWDVASIFWDPVDKGLSSDIGRPKEEETKITTRFIVTSIFV